MADEPPGPHPVCKVEPEPEEQQSASSDSGETSKVEQPSVSRKGQPWTEDEHLAFLLGLQKLGKGNWRGISKHYVPTRTPTQVASHAQKHFLRLQGVTKRKSRFAVVDSQVPKNVVDANAPGVQQHDVVSAPAKSSGPVSSGSYGGFPLPCMVPPMMFAFPPPFVPQMMCPASVAHMSSSLTAPGFYFPYFPAYAGCPPVISASQPSTVETYVVCKPEALVASSSQETREILTALPMSNTTSIELLPSIHSAFRPPQQVRAS